MRQQADRFMTEIERAARLEDAYHAAMRLPSSPYNRLLREGMHFFGELKPGGLKADGPIAPPQGTLTTTQLEALRMVLAKEVAAERDAAARFIPWLATFGSVSPLRSEEHTSELQSLAYLVCRLLLEKKKKPSANGWVSTPLHPG